ncbi:MAG: hypothetical protein IJZ94_05480 [Clostridia bacterium]|nr:hypothetical protein [Clostridia bacterium]
MIAKVTQTQANGKNCFEISTSTGVLFYAQTSWMNINLPFDAQNIRELVFTDCNGEVVYTTSYSVIENTLERALPFKYLYAGEQRFGQYSVIGKNGIEGSFYSRQDGFFDKKYCIEKNGRFVLGYSISKGSFEAISFYEGGRQIAQITKPLNVEDNLDVYFIHLSADRDELFPIIAFFCVYFDYQKYNRAGEIVAKKTEVNLRYTLDKNNKFYNPDWIKNEFGKAEADRFKSELKAHNQRVSNKFRKKLKIFAIVYFSLLAFFLLLFGILCIWFFQPKTPVDAAEFTDRLESLGYQVESYSEDTLRAYNKNFELFFHISDTEEEAEELYNSIKEDFEDKKTEKCSYSSWPDSYQLKTNNAFYLVCCVENTLLIAEVPAEYADEVKDIRDAIEY